MPLWGGKKQTLCNEVKLRKEGLMKNQKKGAIALVLFLCLAVATVFAAEGVSINRTSSRITVTRTASKGSISGALCVYLKSTKADPEGKYHITEANFYYSVYKGHPTDTYSAPSGYEITNYSDMYCNFDPNAQ